MTGLPVSPKFRSSTRWNCGTRAPLGSYFRQTRSSQRASKLGKGWRLFSGKSTKSNHPSNAKESTACRLPIYLPLSVPNLLYLSPSLSPSDALLENQSDLKSLFCIVWWWLFRVETVPIIITLLVICAARRCCYFKTLSFHWKVQVRIRPRWSLITEKIVSLGQPNHYQSFIRTWDSFKELYRIRYRPTEFYSWTIDMLRCVLTTSHNNIGESRSRM